MPIRYLTILGFSEATLSMIFDNLESNNLFPFIEIVNNLKKTPELAYDNIKFNYDIVEEPTKNSNTYILGVTQVKNKKSLVELYKKDNYCKIIHANAAISSTSIIEQGCMINSHVTISAHTKIGQFVTINRNSSIGHHSVIEDFVSINPACNIAGRTVIGKESTIGIGSTILDGVKIGSNSIIGAGSLVTKDIPDHVLAYGSPCKVIREI